MKLRLEPYPTSSLPWGIEHDERGVEGLEGGVEVRVPEVNRLLGKASDRRKGNDQES